MAQVKEKCGIKNRKSPVWKFEEELEELWLKSEMPKVSVFIKIAVANGFPEGSYKSIVKRFFNKYV